MPIFQVHLRRRNVVEPDDVGVELHDADFTTPAGRLSSRQSRPTFAYTELGPPTENGRCKVCKLWILRARLSAFGLEMRGGDAQVGVGIDAARLRITSWAPSAGLGCRRGRQRPGRDHAEPLGRVEHSLHAAIGIGSLGVALTEQGCLIGENLKSGPRRPCGLSPRSCRRGREPGLRRTIFPGPDSAGV